MRLSTAGYLFLLMIQIGRPLATAPAVSADAPVSPEQRELRIERTLACPQCTDLPLDVCDQDICSDMRTVIHEQVAQGMSDAAIRQYFVVRYGSRVLLAPEKSPADLLVWIMPFVGLLAGAALTLAFLRAARRTQTSAPVTNDSDEARRYRGLIEQEVREIE